MFQEEELVPDQEYFSISKIEESHKQLTNQIQEATEERDALKLITQNQLKNINELQEKCEESHIAIMQLPENRKIASERFEETISEIHKLQNKQFEINELLNLSLKEFDDSMQLTNNAKEHFQKEIEIASQRLLIYQANIKEIKQLVEKNIANLRDSINKKSILLEVLKKHSSSISQFSSQTELDQLTERNHDLNSNNRDLRRELYSLEEDLKRINEEMTSLQNLMAKKREILNNKLEQQKLECETCTNCLQELKQEMEALSSKIEFQKNENIINKNKLYEAKMLSSNLKNSIESKKTELSNGRNELEKIKMKIGTLKNMANEVAELKSMSSLKESQIEELLLKKNELLENCSNLKNKLKLINDNIIDQKANHFNILNESEKINSQITFIKLTIGELQTELDNLKLESNQRVVNLSNEIEQLTIDETNIKESIKEKEEIIEHNKDTLISLKNELEVQENMLKQKKENNSSLDVELTEKLEFLRIKEGNLLKELEEKKAAINLRKQYNESVANLHEKINTTKVEYQDLIQRYEKEKEEINTTYSNNLEEKILELQTQKNEKTRQWEAIRDSASKAEFVYYRVKSQAQRLKAEVSCLNENLKTYNCENVRKLQSLM